MLVNYKFIEPRPKNVSPRLGLTREAHYDFLDRDSIIVDSSNRISLVADKSGNSAVNTLLVPGVAGNYASTPDNAGLHITDDLDIRVKVSQVNWSAAVGAFVYKKDNAGNARNYAFLTVVGVLRLQFSDNGTTNTQIDSTANLTALPANAVKWVRVTRERSTGNVKFYTSDDNVTWTQLGATVVSVTTAIFSSNVLLTLGADNLGTGNLLIGSIYYADIRNNILNDGTGIKFQADFSNVPKLATSFVETSATAATVTINTTGDSGMRVSGSRDLYQGTVSKQPIYLSHLGVNYGYQSGVSGGCFSSPSAAPLQITGDIDLRINAALLSWASGAAQVLISRYTSGAGQLSYQFYLGTTGLLQLDVTNDGTNQVGFTAVSSVGPGFAANSTNWIRATRAAATGTVTFYTSSDGVTWVQLGTTRPTTVATIFAGTSPLTIGGQTATTFLTNGKIYRVQILNGIAGTVAFDFNPATYSSGSTFVDASANAATITINGGATVVNRTCVYFDGVDDYSKLFTFTLAQPETVHLVGQGVSWTNADRIYDGNAANTGGLVQNNVTPGIAIHAGTLVAGPNTWLIAVAAVVSAIFNSASSSSRVNRGAASTGDANTGSLSGLTLGAAGNSSAFGNFVTSELIVYSIAHDLIAQDRVSQYEGYRHNIQASR